MKKLLSILVCVFLFASCAKDSESNIRGDFGWVEIKSVLQKNQQKK
jgi:uncharacterized lipoprotein YajG